MPDPSKRDSYLHHAAGLTEAERRLAHRLDALGESERAGAPVGFEERLLQATRDELPAPRSLGGAGLFRGGSQRGWIALAACLAIAAGISWTLLSPSGSGGAPGLAAGSQIASAELEAEVGFTLDALLASYDFESTVSDGSSAQSPDADVFWGTATDDEFLRDLETEIAL
jgi:hypothetical protein